MRNIAVVLAGGTGSRMKSDIPKQYMTLGDRPAIYYTLRAFQEFDGIDGIILVAGEAYVDYCREEIVGRYNFDKVSDIVAGGAQRYDSVYNALKCIRESYSNTSDLYVHIHDGARVCVSANVIDKCIEEVKLHRACCAAVPVKDTIKICDKDGFAINTPDRKTLWQIQTPQSFEFDILYGAFEDMYKDENRGNITDDAMIVEKYTDIPVKMAQAEYTNIKITTPEDIKIAEGILGVG